MRLLPNTASKAMAIKKNVKNYCKCVHFRPKHLSNTCKVVSICGMINVCFVEIHAKVIME